MNELTNSNGILIFKSWKICQNMIVWGGATPSGNPASKRSTTVMSLKPTQFNAFPPWAAERLLKG